ncbi:cytochrome-c peroxidase [Noviherbaspirillum pedocola]|uniref:Cytochrome-c peroxidase n=1 Tax=Noviherbaspirillum pedocola TaxID=2801341 RepID=A0A934SUX9_9BURK|nr:cytochrome c peroxidase [Noviherbaspirillum pedocola]MBK4737266.1 cytochrome-c peroxidase [Noviherbaspirillum pedocola]
MSVRSLLSALLAVATLAGCDDVQNPDNLSSTSASPAMQPAPTTAGVYGSAAVRPPPAQLAAIGKLMFFDASLSASGKLACSSCHDPRHAYGPPNQLSVQLGGKDLRGAGQRAAPSLRYLQQLPPFTEHFHENDGDDSKDQGPTGGHDWDGRADSAHAQAAGPLLSENEMGNVTRDALVAKLRTTSYASTFRQTFGADIFDHPEEAYAAATMALEVFQQSPVEFYPYTSKYDAYLRGEAKLTRQELHGLDLFNDPAKGNCASCHQSAITSSGFPSFTDFGHVALGAPRNRKLPANADPAYFDMGLCGPQRSDLSARKEYCGLFRTPTLRNVAVKGAFFHSGVFHSLEEVLAFYAQRDSHPRKWYAIADRMANSDIHPFDDLPDAYRENVYRDAPFDRQRKGKDALSSAERRDIIAFLKTLTDADVASAAPTNEKR